MSFLVVLQIYSIKCPQVKEKVVVTTSFMKRHFGSKESNFFFSNTSVMKNSAKYLEGPTQDDGSGQVRGEGNNLRPKMTLQF